VIGIAETGSGKTLSFMIPALMHVKNNSQKGGKKTPRVLVMAPTRELALQIEDHTNSVKSEDHKLVCLYGGSSKITQGNKCKSGVDVVIGTPGRIIDMLESKLVDFSKVEFLVFDEADRMLDMGFEPQIRSVLEYIPKKAGERQTMMFSATWPTEVKKIAREYMSDPIQVTKGSTELTANKRIEQIVLLLTYREKLKELQSLLKEIGSEKIIIFGLYKKSVDSLAETLESFGYRNEIAVMHGNKSQPQREAALKEFHEGKKRILVTTDVCARGMDIKKVKYVINYEYPLTTEDYVHRIGRTGRAGEVGKAITFFDPVENKPLSRELADVLTEAGQPVPDGLRKLADSTFARPVRSYTDKLYGGKYEFKSEEKSTHIKF
jgi:superfamily II DNA/RNA helicase